MNKGLSVTDAQQCVIARLSYLGEESVQLEQALGRVLAKDVFANRDLPPQDVSAMDGFAVRSQDLKSIPTLLRVVVDIKAGDTAEHALNAGECARIMTGAPLPCGADAVVRVEDTALKSEHEVLIKVQVGGGHDVRRKGENMRLGQPVLTAGCEITPGVVGVLATVKCASVPVFRRPRVAILSSGDELEALEAPFDPEKIPDSNSYALYAQVKALGLDPVLIGISPDVPDVLATMMAEGLNPDNFDVLLISGGTSVGDYDYVRPTLASLGVSMEFWRVEMKPGHPVAFGTKGKNIVFGLPGNPVSSMVCFEQLVVPALRKMMGYQRIYRATVQARLGCDQKKKAGRMEFVRVSLVGQNGLYEATPTGSQGSADLLSMASANGLMVLAPQSQGCKAGNMVTVQRLDGMDFQVESGLTND